MQAVNVNEPVFLTLDQLSKRLDRPRVELLALAKIGSFPLYVPFFGDTGSGTIGNPWYDEAPLEAQGDEVSLDELIPWEMFASVLPHDFSRICEYGKSEVSAVVAYINGAWVTYIYSQPKTLSQDDFVVPYKKVQALEETAETPLSSGERTTLLKMIGALAMAVASPIEYQGTMPKFSKIS